MYRTAELACRSRLFHHGNLDSEKVPENSPVILRLKKRGVWFSRQPGNRTIRVSGYRIPDLLKELGDEHAERLKRMWRDSNLALTSRHDSLLTHGTRPRQARSAEHYEYAVKELESILVEMDERNVPAWLRFCRATPDYPRGR